jgi:hypothetical protein
MTARRSSESEIAAEAFMSNAGLDAIRHLAPSVPLRRVTGTHYADVRVLD